MFLKQPSVNSPHPRAGKDMSRKTKREQTNGLWVAPDFSLSKRTGAKLLPFPRSKAEPLPSSELEQDTSLARILELADIALSKKKRS
jgi:hypothetical protein